MPERAWRLKKARELVKLLALAPDHRLHREQVMDVLWRDRDPAAAANNLHQAVHVARRALDPAAIEVRDEVLFLAADVDVDRLELAAADARRTGTPAAYRAALAIYGGELLPENRYDDWAADRRDELAELVAELGEELAALGPADGLRGLPTDASSFVGRGRELAELGALLGRTRLLTLTGTAGVGKTRLALELARAAETSYPGGAALVELAAVADPRLVPDAVAAALDVRALPGQDIADALADFLTPRMLLLVVDNCEHLLGPSAALADALLRSAPGLAVLATSREALRIPGEVVFRVPSLDIPDPEQRLAPGELLGYEAVRLFVERATAAAPGFVLDEENAADVARICFRLDGLPLALELAAGRLRALGPAAIAERLDDRFRLLRSGSRAAPTRQQTLAATLQWSHDLLEPDERMLFRRLAVFAGGFELAAAETVCTGDGLDVAGSADVLARLVEKSLVSTDEGGRERRYHLLETVRLYARERLDEAGETTAITGRHAAWALALAEQERDSPLLDREAANLRAALDTLLARQPHDALGFCVALWPFWLRRIDLAEAQRRFAEALAAAPGRTALRAEALFAAAALDFRGGTLSRGMARAEESYTVASEIGDARAEWRAMQFLGEFGIANEQGIVDAATWLERGLELARREGFTAPEAIGVYTLGVARWVLGDLAGAEELLEQSLASLRTLARSPERIPSPINVADMRSSDPGGRPGLRVVFEETLQPFVEVSCDAAVGYVLANLAAIARARGDLARARSLPDEAAERFAQADDERGQADVLVRHAYLELAEGSLPEARACLERALLLRRELHDRRGVGLVLAGLGLIDTTAGDHQSAERLLAEAREIFRRAGDRWGLASTLWRTADLALECGRLDDAEAALQEARGVLGETQRERWIGHTVAGLAEVAVLRGDLERAAALFADARDRYASTDDGLGVAFVEERLHTLAKAPLRPGKAAPDRTPRATTTKGRRT
ncbi:MAG: ATP-binding protein [Gaiellaceae bacterium]